jgi:hypothetical protein
MSPKPALHVTLDRASRGRTHWCYCILKVANATFLSSVSISPRRTIDDLKKQIYEQHVEFTVRCSSPSDLTLTKVRYIMIMIFM